MYPSLSELGVDQMSTESVIAGLDQLGDYLRGYTGIRVDGCDVHDGSSADMRRHDALRQIDIEKEKMMTALRTDTAHRSIFESSGQPPSQQRQTPQQPLFAAPGAMRFSPQPRRAFATLADQLRALVEEQKVFVAAQQEGVRRLSQAMVARGQSRPGSDERDDERGSDQLFTWVRLAAGNESSTPPMEQIGRNEWAIGSLLEQHRTAMLGGESPRSAQTSFSPPRPSSVVPHYRAQLTAPRRPQRPTPIRTPQPFDPRVIEQRFDAAASGVQSRAAVSRAPLPLSATSSSTVVRSARAVLEESLEPLPWEYTPR